MKRWLVPMSISFATFYNIPRFFELERYTFLPTNETLVRSTSLRNNHVYVSIYNTWMKMVSFLPSLFQLPCKVRGSSRNHFWSQFSPPPNSHLKICSQLHCLELIYLNIRLLSINIGVAQHFLTLPIITQVHLVAQKRTTYRYPLNLAVLIFAVLNIRGL